TDSLSPKQWRYHLHLRGPIADLEEQITPPLRSPPLSPAQAARARQMKWLAAASTRRRLRVDEQSPPALPSARKLRRRRTGFARAQARFLPSDPETEFRELSFVARCGRARLRAQQLDFERS